MGASASGLRRMAETWGAWKGRFDPGLLPSSSTQASQFVRNKIIKQNHNAARKNGEGGEIIFSTSQWPRYDFPRLPSPRCPICALPRGSCKFPVNPGAEAVFDAPRFCTTPGTEWGARSTTRVNATIHGDRQSPLLSPPGSARRPHTAPPSSWQAQDLADPTGTQRPGARSPSRAQGRAARDAAARALAT